MQAHSGSKSTWGVLICVNSLFEAPRTSVTEGPALAWMRAEGAHDECAPSSFGRDLQSDGACFRLAFPFVSIGGAGKGNGSWAGAESDDEECVTPEDAG